MFPNCVLSRSDQVTSQFRVVVWIVLMVAGVTLANAEEDIGRWGSATVDSDDDVGRFPEMVEMPILIDRSIETNSPGSNDLEAAEVVPQESPPPELLRPEPSASGTNSFPPAGESYVFGNVTPSSEPVAGHFDQGCWQQIWQPQVWFRYGDPDEANRHRGRGEPLQGTSWLNRLGRPP